MVTVIPACVHPLVLVVMVVADVIVHRLARSPMTLSPITTTVLIITTIPVAPSAHASVRGYVVAPCNVWFGRLTTTTTEDGVSADEDVTEGTVTARATVTREGFVTVENGVGACVSCARAWVRRKHVKEYGLIISVYCITLVMKYPIKMLFRLSIFNLIIIIF